jgi:hypothetical protein
MSHRTCLTANMPGTLANLLAYSMLMQRLLALAALRGGSSCCS